MAVEEGISSTISNIGSGALNIGITLVVVVIGIAVLIGVALLLRHQKRYNQFRVTIFSKDTFGQIKKETDGAGIFVDKTTHNKRLFLKKANVGLNADNVPYISDAKGKKTIYLYKVGLKNFKYINISVKKETDDIITNVGEEDVNWAINAYERAKKSFTQTILMQYLPFITLAFVSLIIMIIFLYFFQQFDVLKELGTSLQSTAQILAGGTTVLPA